MKEGIYMKSIEEDITQYENMKQQIDLYEQQIKSLYFELENRIEYYNSKFERDIKPINSQIDILQQDLNNFILNNKVMIKLDDIIDEIIFITKEKYEDICISGYHAPFIYYPTSICSKKEYIKFIIDNNPDPVMVNISIEGCYDSKPYNLNISFEQKLDDIWADGKTLIEHSQLKVTSMKGNSKEIICSIVTLKDEGIENIFCSFNLKQIVDFKNECTDNLLAQAIINCLNNLKYSKKEKQKRLIKK